MGLISAAVSSVSGVLSDSWKEVIEPDDMSDSTLLVKGVAVKKGSNKKGTDNYVSNGSVIHVYPNTLMLLMDGGKIVVDNSKTAHVYHYIDKEGNPCTEDYLNEHMNMMEVAMLTSGNGAGSKLYTEETFENNDGWGFQHTTVMQNFAAHILTGSPLLAPGEDGINGVNLANSSQLSAWTGREVSNPCDPEEYAAELNKLIEAEGKFPVRE